ncbi:zinc finger matrin-type protein CG9776 isoform X2 [Anoplophora glabripennis]|nr:zinc finger matrin-type protein CG9776 isoform X2 [Anoplophora glabripennis]XP_018577497.1 zinc finger matrin-type protein CG9776 isoform X2 [Anoplophora glabripennis]
MKAIHNVIEMLSSIIKDGCTLSDLEASLGSHNIPNSPATQSNFQDAEDKTKCQSPESNKSAIEKYCYVHYDTGLHWCWLCDEFPETAKDFLLHLQDKKHRTMAKENDVDNTPWHKLPLEPILPSDENAPKKRIPIKGLQFFISAPSWYCKLCDVWIGDLHCASHHLKSKTHYQNYENFVVQNPHWEMEWLKDRERAMARNGVQDSSDSDSNKKKKKHKEKRLSDLFAIKEKKKKKRSKKRKKQVTDSSSSSSSSDSSSDDDEKADRSRSIRVAMRNMKQVQSIMDEDLSSKWNVLERLVEEHKKKEEKKEKEKIKELEDPLINQWMTVSQPQEKDKRLLEDLKDRMKQKQELEKAKQIELEKKKREKEREEKEILERQERAAREAEEETERERKRKEQEELERIRNKDRNQVRFKTNYRKRRTPSRSDEEESPHHEKYKRERYRNERSHEHESRLERSHERENRTERSYERENRSERSHEHESRSERPRERSKSRTRSPPERRSEDSTNKKKPPGPPSYKKLPFIGRMPLFKNKKMEEKEEKKEIQKESYEVPRRTRFQPGNLARAFIPKPDVVCFPKLSSIPPLTIPPPPTVSEPVVMVPEPPKISKESLPKAPPPPKIAKKEVEHSKAEAVNLSDDEMLYAETGNGMNPSMMGHYYTDYNNSMMYSHNYEYPQNESSVPHSHTMPLQPPPLPPDDDLALLGICADDMAAQSF